MIFFIHLGQKNFLKMLHQYRFTLMCNLVVDDYCKAQYKADQSLDTSNLESEMEDEGKRPKRKRRY